MAHIAAMFLAQARVLDAASLGLIRDAVRRAQMYDIVAESDVLLLIDLVLGLGADFETRADASWVVAILTRHSLPGHEKMRKIYAEPRRRRAELANTEGGV